jgi:NAD(P)-dependent dehydrogenase (short-subunit alcohol dehydrogenase family)
VLTFVVYPSEMTSAVIEKTGGVFQRDFVPLRRAGTIEDMSGAILYLTSRAGAYLNGAVIPTDGGRLSVLPSTY